MRLNSAIFFSILFLSLLTAPTVISLTDDGVENIAFLIDINEEEEENKGKEESKVDSKLKIYPAPFASSFLSSHIEITKNVRFLSKNYVSQFPKIVTPPPKFVL